MASQFQNRLVGTIVIVALGVIVLPSLLDGDKKYYTDEFAAIPLVPKEGDEQNTDVLPSAEHALPANAAGQPDQEQATDTSTEIAPPPLSSSSGQMQTNTSPPATTNNANQSVAVETLKPVAVVQKKIESKPVEPKPAAKPVEVKPAETKQTETVKKNSEKAPVGEAYIVQLGALKNAAKVNEIVAMLKLSGYRVYTAPSTPVQGELTRLYVGPDPSKQKLESSLGELKNLTGLTGHVRAYRVSR